MMEPHSGTEPVRSNVAHMTPSSRQRTGDYSQGRDEQTRWDRAPYLVALVAGVIGIAATGWSYANHSLLLYTDAQSHLEIARRVSDSRTPGFVQFGTVWLPLPHYLLWPFVLIDPLWHSGLAGSLVGLICLVITAVTLFLSIRLITGRTLAGWIGVAVLLLNPSLLYIHTTALTEPVLLMTTTVTFYFLVRWSRDQRTVSLMLASLFAGLTVASRYEGWFFVACSVVAIFLTLFADVHNRTRTDGLTLLFAATPLYVGVLWVVFNWVYFSDPLGWLHGASSSQQQATAFLSAGRLPTKGNLLVSAQTFFWAIVDDIGWIVVAIGIIGLVVYAASTRFRRGTYFPYTLLSFLVFNIVALWLGQAYLWVPQIPVTFALSHGLNLRYALLLIPFLAVCIGYLSARLLERRRTLVAIPALCLLLLLQVGMWIPRWPESVQAVAEGRDIAIQQGSQIAAAEFLDTHYDGGGLLLDDAQVHVMTLSRLHMREVIGSFSGQLWREALQDPAPWARWIIFDESLPDTVYRKSVENAGFLAQYTRVFTDGSVKVYKRTADLAATIPASK